MIPQAGASERMEGEQRESPASPKLATSLFPPEREPFFDQLPYLASREPLKRITGRYVCEGCQRSVRFYCYRCYKVAPPLRDISGVNLLPPVSSSSSFPNHLPLSLTIIKHKHELEGKSTAVHAKLLAPESVKVLSFDPQEPAKHLPTIENDTILLFPSSEACSVHEVDWRHIRRLLVIDGTWQQAKSMARVLLEQTAVKCVRLRDTHETMFWRYQSIGPDCLSTIEAIYHFYREFEEAQGNPQDPQLDNLLWFFVHQYKLIQGEYQRHPERRYTSRHRPDYIKHANKD